MCDSNKQGLSFFLAQMYCEVLNPPQTPIKQMPKGDQRIFHPGLFVHSRFKKSIKANSVARPASTPLELLLHLI